MQKWEYLIVFIHELSQKVEWASFNGKTIFKPEPEERPYKTAYEAKLFSQLGEERWELIEIVDYAQRAYFKRPIA